MRQSPQTGDNWVSVAGPVVVDRHFGRVYVYSVRGFLRIQKAQYKFEQGRHAFRATRTCVVGAPDLVYSSLRKYSRQSRLGVLNRHRGSPWLRGLVCVLECGPLKNWTPTWRLRVNPLILCLVTASPTSTPIATGFNQTALYFCARRPQRASEHSHTPAQQQTPLRQQAMRALARPRWARWPRRCRVVTTRQLATVADGARLVCPCLRTRRRPGNR